VIDVTVPAYGQDHDDAVLVDWLVGPGDRVARSQPMARLVVDKVDVDLAAPEDGTVADVLVDGRTTVRSGQVVATITEPMLEAAPPAQRPTERATGSSDSPESTPRSETQTLSRVRKRIARHMMTSLATTAQLTAAVEVDVTRVLHIRAAAKEAFRERHGIALSPFALLVRAAVLSLPRHPAINASIDVAAGTATYHRDVNVGIAVETERGLLVPSVKRAQDLTTTGVARAIAELAAAGRAGTLSPDDLAGSTFTVTNTGSLGTRFGTPILNPPGVAILGTYAAERRPVVVTDGTGDAIAVRSISTFCLTYDHQMVDGADAARFLQDLKYTVETHDFGAELDG
jgi:pyruvate/2-oxoglutarate dehydrogenase complex dihydrolipoamide acyltransferase (E2) component